jgi:hypothetical protein
MAGVRRCRPAARESDGPWTQQASRSYDAVRARFLPSVSNKSAPAQLPLVPPRPVVDHSRRRRPVDQQDIDAAWAGPEGSPVECGLIEHDPAKDRRRQLKAPKPPPARAHQPRIHAAVYRHAVRRTRDAQPALGAWRVRDGQLRQQWRPGRAPSAFPWLLSATRRVPVSSRVRSGPNRPRPTRVGGKRRYPSRPRARTRRLGGPP